MSQFFVFLYAMLATFVIQAMRRNQKLQRPTSQIVTLAGWGLFSLSSTLAVLFVGLAVALLLGFNVPIDGVASAIQ